MTPAIVVLGYERPAALRRLLASLDRAFYPDGPVTLLISLDASAAARASECASIARNFDWRFGPKQVIEQPKHLGVVGHFRAAGDLTGEHGDIILLEDDLTVAPGFYDATSQVIEAYRDDDRIAGFCLYGLWFNGFTQEPFSPIEDGADVFFLRVPYTQGLAFNARQWDAFTAWQASGRVVEHPDLHPSFLSFGPDEWFPSLASYLAQTGGYFCFPRVSLTAGWGDAGAHFAQFTAWFQTSLQMGKPRLRLPPLDEALAVYDGFFELLPDRLRSLAPSMQSMESDLDLSATKQPENLHSDLVLTTRPVRRAESRFGLTMYPPELNVAMNVPGSDIALARRNDVRWDAWSETEARRRLHAYHWRRYRPSRSRSLRFAMAQVVNRIRRFMP